MKPQRKSVNRAAIIEYVIRERNSSSIKNYVENKGMCAECPLREICELNSRGNSAGRLAREIQTRNPKSNNNIRAFRKVVEEFGEDVFDKQIPCRIAFGGIRKTREFLKQQEIKQETYKEEKPYIDFRMLASGEKSNRE